MIVFITLIKFKWSSSSVQVISETAVFCKPLARLMNTTVAFQNEFANDILGLLDM